VSAVIKRFAEQVASARRQSKRAGFGGSEVRSVRMTTTGPALNWKVPRG
jgi:hypothetical protein